jgi:hypothetical protein
MAALAAALGLGLGAGAGCGKKDKGGSGSGSAGSAAGSDAAPAAPLPTLGIDSLKRMNYAYGHGARDYKKALAARKKGDWAAARTACDAALGKDPSDLDAAWLCGEAAAQTGDGKAAAAYLTTALAADWLAFGPELTDDPALTAFRATAAGKDVVTLSARIGDEVRRRATTLPLIVGRRSTFKWPTKSGWAATRGELYAMDPDGPRFVRITHTDDEVAAWLPSPSGAELALVGYDRALMPDAAAAADTPPLLARAWVETLDPKTLAPTGKRVTLKASRTLPAPRALAVYYAAGDQLVVVTYAPNGRWGLGDATAYSIDRATGRMTRTKPPTPVGAEARVSLDEATVDVPPVGVEAAWSGDPPAASELRLTAAGKTVTVPESGKAARGQVVVSPKGTHVAFVTWADPCATDGSVPSLYVVDAASGQLHHILTAPSRFGARWLDDGRLLYEDDAGGLRVWDAAGDHEVLHVAERGGLALRGLSASPKIICTQRPAAPPPAPPPGEGDDEGEGEDMPPEEPPAAPGGSGSAAPASAPTP